MYVQLTAPYQKALFRKRDHLHEITMDRLSERRMKGLSQNGMCDVFSGEMSELP